MEREYPDRPIMAVGVVVIKDGEILLIKRAKPPKQGQWSIPGGAQELGESTVEAAMREVGEETAITIEEPAFLKLVDYIDRDEDGTIRHHYTLVDYTARYLSGEIVPGDDASEVKWVSLENLSDYNLWSETESIIYQAVQTHDITPSLPRRITRAVTGHLRVALIALVFGLTAYGFIHMLIWAMRFFENF